MGSSTTKWCDRCGEHTDNLITISYPEQPFMVMEPYTVTKDLCDFCYRGFKKWLQMKNSK
jgi:hypothetical protein